MSLVTKIFGTYSDHQIKKIVPMVNKIEALAPKYKEMSDAEMRAVTDKLKQRLADGETLGYTAEQKLSITRSEGFNLPGMTLKIGF